MHPLIVTAVQALEDPTTSPAIRSIAAEALLAAMREGAAVPPKTIWLAWGWLKGNPGNRSWLTTEKLGEFSDDKVHEDAIAVVRRDDTDADLRGIAIDILCGPAHAGLVTDPLLLELVDRSRAEGDVRDVGRLLEAVHRARGIAPAVIRTIRDVWSSSSSPSVREVAVGLSAELADPDLSFIEKMLEDPHADVRVAMSSQLERDIPGARLALGAVEARLRVEVHPQARAAILRAHAAIVEEESPRRPRRRG